MTKERSKRLKSLPSEQIPNDGGWHLDRLVIEANERLSKIGKYGKRAKIKVTPKPNKPISIQFSLPGKGQQNPGINLPLTIANVTKAEEIASLVTGQLVAGTFSWEWFNKLIGKSEKIQNEASKQLTCKEMIEQYKVHFLKQRKNQKKSIANWDQHHRQIENLFLKINKPIAFNILRKSIESLKPNSHVKMNHLNGLNGLFAYFNITEYQEFIDKLKKENKITKKKKYIPNDPEIKKIFTKGFAPSSSCPKKWLYRYPQWQFLYSLLTVYGLRIHEAWNIKNWNTPVTLKRGDWVALADLDDYSDDEKGKYQESRYQGNTIVIPAILDPSNKEKLLCIGHETKTGYRVAFPLSPKNENWLNEFNLVRPLNLPDIPDPLMRGGSVQSYFNSTSQTCHWFKRKKYGFTPHALRHAYNIRGHQLGINQKALADSLGHGLQMNSTTYLRHQSDESKLQGQLQALRDTKEKLNKIDLLKKENQSLKNKIKILTSELNMYKAMLENQE